MARNDPQLKFYAPMELKEKIDAAAKASGRSMSAEIVARLEQAFGPATVPSDVNYMLTKLSAQVVAADLTIAGMQMQGGTLAHLLRLAIDCVESGQPLPPIFDGWEELTSQAIKQASSASGSFEETLERFREHTAKLMEAREAVGLSNDTSSPWTDLPPSRVAAVKPSADQLNTAQQQRPGGRKK